MSKVWPIVFFLLSLPTSRHGRFCIHISLKKRKKQEGCSSLYLSHFICKAVFPEKAQSFSFSDAQRMTNIDYKGNLEGLVMSGLREKDLKGVTVKTTNLTSNSKIYMLEKTNEINKSPNKYDKGTILQCLMSENMHSI